MPATVLSIGDGDTIRVVQAGRAITVRLACIVAPETAQRPYGRNARQYLQQRLPVGSAVRLDEKTTDRYGRLVAEVISGANINLLLVEAGQAFAYRQNLGGCDAKAYLDAEGRACRPRLGVWQVEGGITQPWNFRKGRRTAVIPDGTTPDGGRYSSKESSSYARAQKLLRQRLTHIDSTTGGEGCESLRRYPDCSRLHLPNRKPPAVARGSGSHESGPQPRDGLSRSAHQPSTCTVTVLTLWALGAVTVSSPSR